MNLYRVTIQRTILVLGDDEQAAEKEALRSERTDGFGPDFVAASQVENMTDVPDTWMDSVPFGGGAERTCAQIVAERGAHA